MNTAKNVLRWECVNRDRFRPVHDFKQQGAISDPIYMRPIKWKRKGDKLTFKQGNRNKKYRVEYYCDEGNLYKLVLVKDG